MAVTLTSRPRVLIADLSPEGTFYSNWNACGKLDKINYVFNAQETDLASSLGIDIKEYSTDLLLASNSYRPFKVGALVIDVSTFLRAYLYSVYAPDLNAINSVDVGASIRFYIEYRPENGQIITFASDKSNPIYAVNAAMQVGHDSGSNMLEYVPIQADILGKALFLTEFETPVMFEGYPFTMSFLFDNSLGGKEIFMKETELNSNRVELTDNNYELDRSKKDRVNHLTIQSPTNSLTRYIDVYLQTGNDASEYYVDSGYVDEGYTQIIN